MSKKIAINLGLLMGLFIILLGLPTGKVEASSKPTLSGDAVQMVTVKKASSCLLKGEVQVMSTTKDSVKKAKIIVNYNGKRYRDCCAKLLRTEEIIDEKGQATGYYYHVFSFCGCRLY